MTRLSRVPLTVFFAFVALAALVVAPTLVAQAPAPAVDAGQASAEPVEDGGAAGAPETNGWPRWSERWLFNADERTRSGRAATETDRAVERFDTALRLRPDDAATRFNAGTARLRDQRPGARELLQAAANEARGTRLRSRASYNLGNARLEASDLPGAIEAYEDALRADPSFADAKHNLEVALRRLQEQQQNQDQQQDQQQEQDQQDQQQEQDQRQEQDQGQQEQDQQQDQKESGEKDGENEQDEEETQGQGEQQQEPKEEQQDPSRQPEGEGQGQPQESPNARRPLPQFQDLPDMSAEEAAAILEAIENMEREERRDQALEAARKAQASGKKDW